MMELKKLRYLTWMGILIPIIYCLMIDNTPKKSKGHVKTHVHEDYVAKLSDKQKEVLTKVVLDPLSKIRETVLDFLSPKDQKKIAKLIQADLKKAEDFIPFVRNLEAAYIDSIKSNKPLFGNPPTSKDINAKKEKYNLCRTLGVLLQTTYQTIEDMGIDSFQKRVPDVGGIRPIKIGNNDFRDLELSNEVTDNIRSAFNAAMKND